MKWVDLIKSDFRRKQALYAEDGARVSLLRILCSDGSSSMVIYRLTQAVSGISSLAPLALLLQWLNKFLNGCVIGVKADFGPGFVVMHSVGVVVNSKVVAGSNLTLEGGVVIGDEKGQSPVLGDQLFIGSGAKIIGGVRIGNNVKIGANAVVVHSIDSDSTAVGIPAKASKQTTE